MELREKEGEREYMCDIQTERKKEKWQKERKRAVIKRKVFSFCITYNDVKAVDLQQINLFTNNE